MSHRTNALILLIASILGFAIASYLSFEHYRGELPVCGILPGCEKVLTSVYSVVYGVPLALLGSFYYLVVLFGTVLYLDTKKTEVLKYTGLFTIVGGISSLYFMYLQFIVIESICVYCTASALLSFILCGVGVPLFFKRNPSEITH